MSTLKLSYKHRYALWSDLLRASNDRLFVPTDERPDLNQDVALEIRVSEFALPVVLHAAVTGWRPASERFERGVYLHIPTSEVDKCRRFLGLKGVEQSVEHARTSLRAVHKAPVRFLAPPLSVQGITKNVAESGLFLRVQAALPPGTRVKIELELSPSTKLVLDADVAWAVAEDGIVGLKFVDVAPAAAQELHHCIGEILDSQQRSGQTPNFIVLVADDDPSILAFLTMALSKHGAQVFQATDGAQTLQMVRQLRPDLVVMDILMPAVDGADVCKAMRADAELADTPVIFISALEPNTLHQVAFDAGATDYLTKPVALGDLLNLVGRYLKR